MSEIGRILFVLGVATAALGLLLWSGFGREWFGRLPGDIHVTRGGTRFYFPIVTCLLLSLLATAMLWWFRR